MKSSGVRVFIIQFGVISVSFFCTQDVYSGQMSTCEQNILSLTNGLQHGEYYMGPVLPLVSPSPVKRMKEFLAKSVDSSEFVTMKILNFSSNNGKT